MTRARFILLAAILVVFAAGMIFFSGTNYITRIKNSHSYNKENKEGPADWFYIQRSYPDKGFDIKAYRNVLSEVRSMMDIKNGLPGCNGPWVLEGPTNINGRVNCIAVHPQNSNIIFAGSASGGIFKSINGGSSWTSVFDSFSYLAIGDIEFDPQNPNIMYAGTGDPNISGYPFIGEGLFKSIDGGQTWSYSGLADTYIISKICINPKKPDTLYVGTMGLPFVRDNNRGLYMSTNGGQTWTQKLFISNQAGIIDMMIDPDHPDSVYAAGWDRIRNNQESVVYGSGAKIYKTFNAGTTWNPLTNGLPSTDMSRIGLCMSKQNSQTLYASYVSPFQNIYGIYKTTNGGQSWVPVDTTGLPSSAMGGFGWYFGQIRVNPTNDNELYLLGVDLWRKPAGGGNWEMAAPEWWQYIVHADKHDMVLLNNSTFLLAADGGIYKTIDHGNNWTDADFMPSTQFYRVNTNPHEPGVYYGGAQDNGTLGGNAAHVSNWTRILGGDGFQPIFDPYDPALRYCETQNGALYYDDGAGFMDFTYGIDYTDRRSWDMPVIMSSFDNQKFYTGTYRVYRIPDAPYGTWVPISNDLTDGVIYGERYHVITTVAESPVNANMLYAGTSDGNVWRSLNGGSTWDNVTTNLPDRYVTHIIASPTFAGTVYVAHSGYRYNEFIPHIHKSVNNGSTWTDISGNLPQFAINNIEIPAGFNDDIIFAATDGGVYATIDGGTNWNRLGASLPLVTVYDIVYDTAFHKLVAGTYGRAIQSYNLDSLFQYYQSLTGNNTVVMSRREIRIYPNPVHQILHIAFSGPMGVKNTIRIFDVSGKEYSVSWQNQDGNLSINAATLPKGVYWVAIYTEDHQLACTGKFIRI